MFIDVLQKLCDERGISVYKATMEVGLNRSAVAKWKKGATPNGETLKKLAQFFGVDYNYLLEGKSERSDAEIASEDPELSEILEKMKNRPEMRMLFKLSADASADDVKQAIKIIEALRKEE